MTQINSLNLSLTTIKPLLWRHHALVPRTVMTSSQAANIMRQKTKSIAFCCKKNECARSYGFYFTSIERGSYAGDPFSEG